MTYDIVFLKGKVVLKLKELTSSGTFETYLYANQRPFWEELGRKPFFSGRTVYRALVTLSWFCQTHF